MRGLKVLVVVMGVMIVVGFAALIVIMVGRLSNRAPAVAGGPARAAAGQPYTAPAIELPPGARIETMAVGSDRLVLDVALPLGGRELLVIDLATGRRLGTVPLPAAP